MLCKRVENEEWGTIDYINDTVPEENANRIVFRTRKEVRRRPTHQPPLSASRKECVSLLTLLTNLY